MNTMIMQAEPGGLLIVLLLSWIAASKAYRLVYGATGLELHRKAGGLMIWAAVIVLAASGVLAAVGWAMQTMLPEFWQDRVYLHAPLIGIPALSILFIALPMLWRVRRQAKPAPEEAPQPGLRGLAAAPGIVLPFQAAALGALTALYMAFTAPVPFEWTDAIPLAVYVLLVAALAVRHGSRSRSASREEAEFRFRPWLHGLKALGMTTVAAAAAAGLLYLAMLNSLLPERFNMMAGPAHYAATSGNAAFAGTVSVTGLTGPRTGEPDRKFTLTAEKKKVRLSSGQTVEAWTYNGQIPGPELRVKQGELVEVTLVNKNIEQGATIHWHGLDVPNAEDGVAGVTQDAVMPGQTHTYRFVAEQAGTFWYHSHQQSKEAVQKGLFGSLIVEPSAGADPKVYDFTVMTHRWDQTLAVGASDTVERVSVLPGTPVRLRLINTDDWTRQRFVLAGTPFQVASIDGTDLYRPGLMENVLLTLTTGGRYDVTFTMPDHPVFLDAGAKGKVGLFLSPDGQGAVPDTAASASTMPVFDPSDYGDKAVTPFDANSHFDRQFTMILDNKLGFYNGQFDMLYTMNGEVFPNTPAFMVSEGDLVKTTLINRSAVDHPMHLHGHRMLVLSHNGRPVKGTWWSDTLDVRPGDVYEVAFRADNPGIWMDHCHNLAHAASGMTMHLMYENVTTPFLTGSGTANRPE
ncbi:Blue copper oxidase CueO precursor [Paenibacillus konkukensis]|uniref:Copper-containing nitrite reductase n=2 Tax=Paenibacillus konkukensis TaxID=2020716 RepID=A0ABY4RRA3_9BACL|nr:Blue copper oxidase CueO precursor [Paenibacillus konkukensis]